MANRHDALKATFKYGQVWEYTNPADQIGWEKVYPTGSEPCWVEDLDYRIKPGELEIVLKPVVDTYEAVDAPSDGVLSGDFNHAVFTLSQGVPGAISAIMNMVASSVQIDPQAWAKELHPIQELDGMGIRGSEIHDFFKYTCNGDLVTAFAMFRSLQLGFLRKDFLLDAIRDRRPVEGCEQFVGMVKARLESFAKGYTAQPEATSNGTS